MTPREQLQLAAHLAARRGVGGFDDTRLPGLQASTGALTKMLGLPGNVPMQLQNIMVPAFEASELVMQQQSEELLFDQLLLPAHNVGGTYVEIGSVPDGQLWRCWQGAYGTDVIDADQAVDTVNFVWGIGLATNFASGILGQAASLFVQASTQEFQSCFEFAVAGGVTWWAPGTRFGIRVTRTGALLTGAAGSIPLRTRLRVTRVLL